MAYTKHKKPPLPVAKGNDKGAECELAIYEEIGSWSGVSARAFRDQLKAAGEVSTIHLRLNSPGGEVFDGLAIYNLLKDHKARKVVHVDGMALSMASVIAMAGDEIEIADNGFLMIHNPAGLAFGDSADMQHMADLLAKVKDQLVATYAARTKQPADKIAALMDAETWLTGEEAVDLGFADRCSGVLAIAASVDPKRFTNTPANLLNRKEPTMPEPTNTKTPATLAELKAACPGSDADFRETCLEAGKTVAEAQAEWLAKLAAENAALKAKAKQDEDEEEEEEEKEECKKDKAKNRHAPGVTPPAKKPSGEGNGATGDPIADFNAAVHDNLKLANGDRRRAIALAARQNPALHEEYLLAVNASKPARVKDLIRERFAS